MVVSRPYHSVLENWNQFRLQPNEYLCHGASCAKDNPSNCEIAKALFDVDRALPGTAEESI